MYFIFFRNTDTYVVDKHMNTKRRKEVVGGIGRLGLTCIYIYIYTCIYTIDWRRQWHPTRVLLPGKSHGQRSLVRCSPWDRWGSDTTEQLRFHFSLACIGEGNGNPLQCSFLENPRDGGAWWAAIYGVAQSRTRLKWLSSILLILCIKRITQENLLYSLESSPQCSVLT